MMSRKIHKAPCRHCPTIQLQKKGIEDIESKDIKQGVSKERIAKEFLFDCAWRKGKLCKGMCDYYGIDQKYLNEIEKQ